MADPFAVYTVMETDALREALRRLYQRLGDLQFRGDPLPGGTTREFTEAALTAIASEMGRRGA